MGVGWEGGRDARSEERAASPLALFLPVHVMDDVVASWTSAFTSAHPRNPVAPVTTTLHMGRAPMKKLRQVSIVRKPNGKMGMMERMERMGLWWVVG